MQLTVFYLFISIYYNNNLLFIGTTTSMSTLHMNYDVGDIVQKRVSLESLDPAETIKYVENHFRPSPSYQLFCTQVVDKGTQGPKTLMFQSSWLDQYNWLVYSASDAGGYCKLCVMFPPKNSRLSNAVLVNRPFQNLQKAKGKEGVLDRHGQQDYHKSSVTECKLFCQAFRQPENHVDTLLNQKRKKTYEDNVHILKSIILAVILCGKQNIPLRGHRDDGTSLNSNTGNFLAVLELLATRDDILCKHLENGKKNCRYTSKTIQNQIINVIADYLRNKITRDLTEGKIFLSLHDMGFDIENLRGQGYDGASAMSSSIQGVNGRIREIAPLQADEYKEYDQFSERGIPILRQFPQETDVLGENLRQDRKCIQ